MRRKNQLENGQVYHIYSRSIADFKIFNAMNDYQRMLNLILFYQLEAPPTKYSEFIKLTSVQQFGFRKCLDSLAKEQDKIVQIIAYCLMPTHIHLILKQISDKGISIFMSNVLNGYTRYFNIKHHRKGPLWESKFKNVCVETDDQLLHLTRYIHLNPVTAYLVDNPGDWLPSSYLEYLSESNQKEICQFNDLLEINPQEYARFVKDQISYQRDLAKIKELAIDNL